MAVFDVIVTVVDGEPNEGATMGHSLFAVERNAERSHSRTCMLLGSGMGLSVNRANRLPAQGFSREFCDMGSRCP